MKRRGRENKSKYAVLGVLSLRPMSGYDIRKMIDASLANFWSESYGQIYPILRRLVDEKLATRHTEPGEGRPDRHVYTITEAGRAALDGWLREPAAPDVLRIEILLKLFFGDRIGPVESLRHVERFRQLHEGNLKRYRSIEEWLKKEHGENPRLPYWMLTIAYGRHLSQGLLDWCDEAEGALKRREPVNMYESSEGGNE